MNDLKAIAQRPHPIGSDEHAKVAAYITQKLSDSGLETDTRSTPVINHIWGNLYTAATVRNILGRLKGTGNGKAVLLVAHYDSVPNSPGASDNGAAVAALLEVARASKSLPPPKNDLIFLFADGEEASMVGAAGFVEHPWARNIGLTINFDARGSSGPVYMFETSPQNGWLIQEFAKATPRPFSSSLMYEIYKILPNDTDLTVFKQAGFDGLNFANIDGATHYHNQTDNLESVDQRTLQHKGSIAAALVSHFANLNLDNVRKADAIYFDISGLTVLSYPASWRILFAVLTLVVFVAVFILGRKRGRLTFLGTGHGIVVFVVSVALPAVVVLLISNLVGRLFAEYRVMTSGSYHGRYLFISYMALTVASFLGVIGFAQRRVRILDLWAGALLVSLILMLAGVFFLPGASYLLTWPLLLSLLALGVLFITKAQPYRFGRIIVFSADPPKRSFEEFITVEQLLVLSLCTIPAVILWVPVIDMVYLGVGLSYAVVLVILAGLLLGLMTPHLVLMTKYNRWVLSAAFVTIGVGFLLVGMVVSGFDARHPKPNSIFYGLDADKNEARFLSTDANEDEWTSQFFKGAAQFESAAVFFPVSNAEFLQGPAPAVSLSAPAVTVLEDSSANNLRTLRLRIASPRRAPMVSISVEGDVVEASLDGQVMKVSEKKGPLAFRYYALGESGVDLLLRVKPGPVKIRAVDISYGLPDIQGLPTRPEYMMPTANRTFSQNSTMVSKSFTF